MAEPLMLTVLRKAGLQEVYESFEREAITPDIISLLSKQNLQFLGIPNATDMMRLRAECVKYGKSKPQKIGYSGAPTFDIDKLTLDSLLDCGFQISDIAKLLLVSECTIYRRMAQFGLSKQGFSEIDDGDLERVVLETIKDFPMCGEQMLRQLLRTKGLKIQRWRLRDCIHEIDSSGVRARKAGRLHRRTYNVMAPNHLWHIDTNHKLIRWRKVGLQEVYESFEREAITPDTISLLSKQNLQFLGIPNATDMMRLRQNEIDDGDLERVVSETIKDFPMCGEQMPSTTVKNEGLKIQRWRLRDCIHEIDSSGVR
ncbi:Hypothetical predicted protein [Mytilus galloprovincialis]|uniref:Integrase core domain-containing protein n=1 Tax=Mytilus galloprovincialis TaxID=29158 RepID=A0A8B6HCK5_MYTGA|nr:Hypothetical predicted protein [Mytilus galloprovincialis]